ncbi:MAG TPA: hypothetical protein VGV06_07365 [Methylomirabilota bacterium]|nr:hypothetical protein [Methylomirabilota bacterium]
MEMWNSIDSLKSLSHTLLWATIIFAIFVPLATGIRYYVDRRASELSSKVQLEREAELKLQLDAAQREQQEAREKLSKIEQNVKGRHLSSEQSAALTVMARKSCHSLPMVHVTAANSNHEAQVYATDFVKALKAAGCASDLALPIPGLTPDVIGVHIGVRDTKNISPAAIELSKILSGIGVQFGTSPIKPDFFPEAQFVLVIGGK